MNYIDEQQAPAFTFNHITHDAMQAILSSTDNKVYLSSLNVIPKNAVIIADELVRLLKGE